MFPCLGRVVWAPSDDGAIVFFFRGVGKTALDRLTDCDSDRCDSEQRFVEGDFQAFSVLFCDVAEAAEAGACFGVT